jgi:hypothetical protein
MFNYEINPKILENYVPKGTRFMERQTTLV